MFCSFDIEIARIIPEGALDWEALRPFGITCAATLLSGVVAPTRWFGQTEGARTPAPRMTPLDCRALVNYLVDMKERGYTPLTWNGLGFDFKILAEESGMFEECRELALSHVDMMFQFFCLKGFAISLDKACKGMGLMGKPHGMSGAEAPLAWKQGRHQEVLDYVANDVVQPLLLAEEVEEQRRIMWVARSGRLVGVYLERWLTVREALELPEPDTSWMDDPWPRSKFYEWTERR